MLEHCARKSLCTLGSSSYSTQPASFSSAGRTTRSSSSLFFAKPKMFPHIERGKSVVLTPRFYFTRKFFPLHRRRDGRRDHPHHRDGRREYFLRSLDTRECSHKGTCVSCSVVELRSRAAAETQGNATRAHYSRRGPHHATSSVEDAPVCLSTAVAFSKFLAATSARSRAAHRPQGRADRGASRRQPPPRQKLWEDKS